MNGKALREKQLLEREREKEREERENKK